MSRAVYVCLCPPRQRVVSQSDKILLFGGRREKPPGVIGIYVCVPEILSHLVLSQA